MDINLKINDVPVIGSIKIKGVTYYVDKNKTIYTQEGETYSQVTDEATLRMILDYISPRSMDII